MQFDLGKLLAPDELADPSQTGSGGGGDAGESEPDLSEFVISMVWYCSGTVPLSFVVRKLERKVSLLACCGV